MTKDRVYNSSGMSEGDAFDRDQAYWNAYYTVHTGQSEEPSEFAKSIVDKMIVGRHLLELGCGNGRDSLFFLKNGLKVTAVDASDVAINSLVELTKGNPSASFVCDDFVIVNDINNCLLRCSAPWSKIDRGGGYYEHSRIYT